MAKRYSFDERGARRIVAAVRQVEGEPVDLTGDNIGTNTRTRAIVVVKAGESTADGIWEGYIQKGGITPGGASWSTQQMLMPQQFENIGDGSVDCFIISTTGARILEGSYYPCVRFGTSADSPARPIFIVISGGHCTFPVKVTKTGGSDGTKTTAATWVYTVKDMNESVLGTNVNVARTRPNGKMAFGTTYGLAFYDAGVLKLWDAGERPGTGSC